ncbi:hypothetical protein OG350_36695 [Streptomyces achromogenes]|uniref:Uncharacterized protein n=1 Tax=Streptomyces achromogenes TaxID=67255 RepID=A0ABZ1L335_STRAH
MRAGPTDHTRSRGDAPSDDRQAVDGDHYGISGGTHNGDVTLTFER